jgi:HAD superfamily hydrolase (TIGR01509 family)
VTDVAAVIFDLDGVLIDSETIWDDARRSLVEEQGGTWLASATRDMMGMSSREWSVYLHERLGVGVEPGEISSRVADDVAQRYHRELPLLPGACDAVLRLASAWPLGLASSSNRTIIELFLDVSGLRSSFAVTVSSEEVTRGKPAPDVYLAAAAGLCAEPARCVAIEDSTNGLAAATAARMTVIAVPNRHFPPSADALSRAALVVASLVDLTEEQIRHRATP